MAELSEKDKLTLWGTNYKEVLAQADTEEGAARNVARLSAAKLEKCNNSKFSAMALMVIGVLLSVSNFYAISGPSVMLVGVFGIAAFVLGAAWYARLWKIVREITITASAG